MHRRSRKALPSNGYRGPCRYRMREPLPRVGSFLTLLAGQCCACDRKMFPDCLGRDEIGAWLSFQAIKMPPRRWRTGKQPFTCFPFR